MKNICFLGLDFKTIAGAPRITVDVVNELSNYFKIHLLVLGNFNYCIYNLNKSVKLKFFNLYDKNTRIFYSILKSFFKIISYIKKEKINIIVSSGSFSGPIIFLIKILIKLKLINCKILFWEHESIINRNFKSMFIRKLCYFSCDALIVISKKTMQSYKKILKNKKIFHIYNFTNFKFNDLKYNIESKSIISVGSIEFVKGFDLAIEVAKIIFKYKKDWIWNIYGNGSQKKVLEERVKKLNLESNIKFKGEFKNINKEYIKHSIYVLCSRREGFSLVLLEAKINNLPVVSFDCPCGPSEIIQDKVNSFLINCYDIDKMAKKIIYLIDKPDVRKKFSENSKIGLENFDKNDIVKKWIKMIKTI